jgi:hypothetical protein
MAIKKCVFLLIFGVMALSVFSQIIPNPSSRFDRLNSVQVELFGHGLFYSINYERILLNGPRFKTAIQAGLAYYPPKTSIKDLWLPVVVNQLYSFHKHHIELGFGYIFINEAYRDLDNEIKSRHWTGFLTGRIGYRYQKPQGRFLLRAGFTPIMEYSPYRDFHPVGGLAIGYTL